MKDDERFYWFVKWHMKWLSERIGEERAKSIPGRSLRSVGQDGRQKRLRMRWGSQSEE